MDSCPKVAELQGLYGVYGFPEKLLQQIWSRAEFDREATVLADGRPIRVIEPGRWNLLGGPDFRDAQFSIAAGPILAGDVELHLHAEDWAAHRHSADRAYDNVILHVVLFPPRPGYRTRTRDGADIPILPLLTALPHDLESYAADAVVERLADRSLDRDFEDLSLLPPGEIQSTLLSHATHRWRQKVHFARLRINQLGWDSACHHAALEVLGYRFNRSPMLRIASRFPLQDWANDPAIAQRAYQSELHGGTGACPSATAWSKQGLRPANHPRIRLEQYAHWVAACPNWPAVLASSGPMPLAPCTTRAAIRAISIPAPRFSTLCCDALLPLLAARSESRECGTETLRSYLIEAGQTAWSTSPAGDVPDRIRAFLRKLTLPPSHGNVQGLLGWLLSRQEPRPR